MRARWALGCFGYTALSFAWLFGTAMAGSSVYGRSLPPGVVLGGWVAMTVGLLGLTLWLRIRFGYKGYGYGILTAIGSALLLLGGLILLIIATCGHSKW